MTRRTEIIGKKEYAFFKIPPFDNNLLGLKIQKIVLPVLGAMKDGSGKSLMEMDLKVVSQILSDKLDESVMTDIIMPMFKISAAACVTDNVKIDSVQNFNKVFAHDDGLADMYELVYVLLQYNFANFFSSLFDRIGNRVGTPATKE